LIAASQLLLLLLIANGAPIIARRLLRGHCNWPVDAGRMFMDGHPWLGPSKTVRGIVAAVLACVMGAELIGIPVMIGVLAAVGAMSGDLLSSFVKRRLGIPPSGMTLGLDQIPEALIPTLLIAEQLGLTFAWGVAVIVVFMVLELSLSRLLFTLHIRKRPY
jgi:CDP-2,3-bis-(O-geranylgeranyl)-sn-glycerol synthase